MLLNKLLISTDFRNRNMKTHHKYILFLSCFLLFLIRSQAQNAKIDSLKKELLIHKEKDTIRVNLLYDLAYYHFQTDMNLTNTYLKESENLSNNLNYIRGKAKVNYLKGMLENMKSNYTTSLSYFNRSLKYYKSIKDKDRIASVYMAFGINYYDLARYDEALNYYKKATQIYQDLGNKRELITSLINIGNVYSELGRYDESISNYKKALKQSEAIKDEDGISYVHSNLGIVYKVQGNYPLAIDNLNKSLNYNKKANDSLNLTLMLNNLGDIYTSMGKYDKALEYLNQSLNYLQKENKRYFIENNISIGNIYRYKKAYEKALDYYYISLKLSQETNNLKQTSICFNNIGEIYLLLNKPLIARENFIKAKDISQEIDSKHILASSFLGIAESYLNENQPFKALDFAKKSKNIAEKLALLETQKKATQLLSNIYKKTGDYKNALENHEQFKILNDSLFNKENIEKITQLEYEYQYKQALDSASIRELKLTNEVKATSQNLSKTQRNYLWAIIGVLLVSMTLGTVIFFQKLRNAKTKTENAMIEQKLLRSQMTPHFIFNSLSVLQGMILNKEAEKAVHYLSKFSKLMRITLENSRDKTVSLEDELTAIQNYLELQNLENEVYEYTILVDETIDIPKFKIPPMLIQPFVENAIEHAFVNQKEHRKIDIRLTFQENKLICTVSDNGIGVSFKKEHKAQTKKSLATTITSERLKMLSKDLKMFGSVMVEDRKKYGEQGTVVTLQIPHKTLAAS